MKRIVEIILNINEKSMPVMRVKVIDEIAEKPHRGDSMVEMRIGKLPKAL